MKGFWYLIDTDTKLNVAKILLTWQRYAKKNFWLAIFYRKIGLKTAFDFEDPKKVRFLPYADILSYGNDKMRIFR